MTLKDISDAFPKLAQATLVRRLFELMKDKKVVQKGTGNEAIYFAKNDRTSCLAEPSKVSGQLNKAKRAALTFVIKFSDVAEVAQIVDAIRETFPEEYESI